MKTSDNIYGLVSNASTFAVVTPGSYWLDKPLQIPQKASHAGVFRLICTGCTFYLSTAFCASPVPLYIEGGTFYASSLNLFDTSHVTPTEANATLQGTLLVGSSPFSDATLSGSYWAAPSL